MKTSAGEHAYMVGYVHCLPRPGSTVPASHNICKIPLIDLHIAVVISRKGTYLHIVPVDPGLGHAFEVLGECFVYSIFSGSDYGLLCTGGGFPFWRPAGWTDIEEEFEVFGVYSHICRQTS